MLFIMDGYLQFLYEQIIVDIADKAHTYIDENAYTRCSVGLHKLVQEVDCYSMIFNFNEESKLHSQYLGDRYEPAIILNHSNSLAYYYLFDGEIKDCVHPFSIKIYATEKYITYYSSERIEQELPIYIIEAEFLVIRTYNRYELEALIEGYKSGSFEIAIDEYVRQDYTLHDCMERASFKFAD